MELEDEKKYSAAYLAEKQKEKEAELKLKEKAYKQSEHRKEREKKLKDDPEGLFYVFLMCGAGVAVQLEGFFDRRFIVKESAPEYKSVDNVLRYVVFPDPGEYVNAMQSSQYKMLRSDNAEGDKYRQTIFEAYENALKIFEYCRNNKISRFNFTTKMNPDYMTLYDHEVKKFFKDLKEEK